MEDITRMEASLKQMLNAEYSDSYIKEKLKVEFPDAPDSLIDHVACYVKNDLSNRQFTGLNEVLAIHLHRYNVRIQKLLSVQDPDDLPAEERKLLSPTRYHAMRQAKIRATNDVVGTLQQKEELLQFHNEGFELEINNEETIELKESKPEIDILKLTLAEQVELLELFKKAKVSYKELPSVTSVNDSEDTIENDCLIIDEELNINKIQLEEQKEASDFLPFKTDPKTKLLDADARAAAKAFETIKTTL